MKNYIYIIAFLFCINSIAQNKENNDGIALGAYVPQQAEHIPRSAKKMLINKLGQIITKNGIGDVNNSRFIITPNISVLSKDITPTAPPKVALNLELTLYMGDGIAGNLFASESFSLKGVGTNENKAYIAAIKRLKPKNPEVLDFVTNGKNKIIEYYNNNCGLIIKKADALEAQNQFDEALLVLANVPEVSTCFDKVSTKMKNLYQKAIDRDCEFKYNEASAIWAANQDIDAANEAGGILSSIDPRAKCMSKVKALFNKISTRVKDVSDRDWKIKLKILDLKKTQIQAARDVGVAYGRNQPQNVSYNINSWR